MPPSSVSDEFLALQSAVAGRYSLERELGRGGMGVVFLARDVALDRPVAIKLLPRAMAESPQMRESFLREARTAARLSHPHIVPIHAVEAHDHLAFFVMAYVDGETLGERIRRAGALPPGEAMRVIQEVAWALAHAHAHGVVHRDVKPDNILLERGSGRALVSDFGIARLESAAGLPAATPPSRGTVTGTPRYMSPEQASGDIVDARSDIYSLGITAWIALAGRHPFEADSILALRTLQLSSAAPSLAEACPSAPPALARAIGRALEIQPAQRFQSADELAEVVRTARGAEPAVAVPVRRFVAEAEAAGGEIGTALTAAGASVAVPMIAFEWLGVGAPYGFMHAFILTAYWSVAAVTSGLALVRVGQLIDRARHLVRGGYGHEAVRPAFAIAERERAEDRVGGDRAARRETLLLGTVGAAKTSLAVWLYSLDAYAALQLAGFVGSIAIPTITIRKLWTDLRRDRPSLWNRLLAGRAGRWLFGVAGIGLGDRAPALPAAGEPTALAVGRAAGELFSALAAAQRERLRDVPDLIERLERDALALRARGEEAAASERHATVVAALEALRLDLLRLHAGTATLDDLTADLEAARRVRAEIDARMAGEQEVRRVLERTPGQQMEPRAAPTVD